MQTDLLILGGGCAGLSLARQLCALPEGRPHTVILERRSAYFDDRTWCFWEEPSARLTHLASHRWSKVSLAAEENAVEVDCASSPYAMIPSRAFYDDSISQIERTSEIQLKLEVAVLSEPQKREDRWQVETTDGPYTARFVVDTRPARTPAPGGALLWQSFAGQEVECADAVFQPGVAELMHFAPSSRGAILFFYLLPFSERRALLEATVFAPQPLSAETFQTELNAFVAQRTRGGAYTIRRTEHGILPMGLPASPPPSDGTFLHAGLMAGGARPSSGYAFQRIQRWAAACANALGAGLPPVGHPRDPLLLRTMDRLFLGLLRRRPDLAPDLFLDLFAKVDFSRLVRFLSDRATLADYAAIAWALPPSPFIRQAFLALLPFRQT